MKRWCLNLSSYIGICLEGLENKKGKDLISGQDMSSLYTEQDCYTLDGDIQ
jgi:hypothetical protein